MKKHKTSLLKTSWPYIVWLLSAAFYFYDLLLQVSPSVMVPELMRSFNVNAASLGNLAAFYFYAYTLMQIPVGALIDKYGPRYLLSLASCCCLVGCFLFGTVDQFGYAALGRLLIGFGSAFAVVGCLQLSANWFRPKRFALLTGLMVSVGMLGAINGETTLALLLEHVGWRETLVFLGIIGGVLSLLILAIVRDYPPMTVHTTQKQMGLWEGLPQIVRDKQSWLIAFYGSFMFAPTLVFAGLWGVSFFITAYHLTRPHAASLISLIFVGWMVGGPIVGWFSDYIQRRKVTMFLGSSFAFILMMIILYIHLSNTTLAVVLFCFGFVSSGFLPAYAIIRELHASMNNRATAFGFMNMMNSVGGALFQPFVGYILDISWNGMMKNHVPVYTTHNYRIAMMVLPIIIGLSLLLVPFIKETYCKEQ